MVKYTLEFKWASIFIAMVLIWVWLEKALGYHDEKIDQHAVVTNIIMIPAILIYVFAFREKKEKEYAGQMTWKQGFMMGAIMSVIIAVASPLSQYVVSTIISPDYFQNAIKYSVENGKLTQVEAEKYFNLSSYMIQALIGSIAMGLVTSAIVALFTRSSQKSAT